MSESTGTRIRTSYRLEELRTRLLDMTMPFNISELAELIAVMQERLRREQDRLRSLV